MRIHSTRARGGLTLLEVLVALAILGFVAAGFGGQGSQQLHSMRLAEERERRMALAVHEMTRATVELRVASLSGIQTGSFVRYGLRVTTLQIEPSIYEITVSDSAGSAALLRTSIYRRGVE
jgi:prepilin-type N-terminal cleavage/methylation domain-containing protein